MVPAVTFSASRTGDRNSCCRQHQGMWWRQQNLLKRRNTVPQPRRQRTLQSPPCKPQIVLVCTSLVSGVGKRREKKSVVQQLLNSYFVIRSKTNFMDKHYGQSHKQKNCNNEIYFNPLVFSRTCIKPNIVWNPRALIKRHSHIGQWSDKLSRINHSTLVGGREGVYRDPNTFISFTLSTEVKVIC
jgi:hypothetical protein